MTTLRLPDDLEPKRIRRRSVYSSRLRPYVGRRSHDEDLRVKEPSAVQRVMLTLQMHRKLQREKILNPALQPTHRTLLRWAEGGGNGLPNPQAEVRETHYDPLPPDVHEKVEDIVTGSPWETLIRKWYRTSLTNQELIGVLGVGRTQLYVDWNAALWYYRGRFEAAGVYG